MESIVNVQKKIDAMEYWDARVLDFRCQYFGDSIEVFLEDDDEYIYKLTLKQCFDVSYNNPYTIESDIEVKDMNKLQLGYFAQDITVEQIEDKNLYKVSLDLPMMFCVASCKSISVDRIKKDTVTFFWSEV